MELNNKLLDEWLKTETRNDQFPNGRNYGARYIAIADELNKGVHIHVTAGAAIKDGGYLTDHGPEHIKTVIQRATNLVSAKSCDLTPYEVYLLLVAIHIHDTGNAFGRYQHEQNSIEVFRHIGTVAGEDEAEKRVIARIAVAHGGKEKDKISLLPETQPILGQLVRTQLLAAILKFADELADDYTRAAGFFEKHKLLPKESEVYHRYSGVLHSVTILPEEHEVKLDFLLNKRDIVEKFGKKTEHDLEEVHLLNEIYVRTTKTHLERTYCMRFMSPYIRISRITVTIEFCDDMDTLAETAGYRMEEHGYPSMSVGIIHNACRDLKTASGVQLTGESLKEQVELNEKAVTESQS
ncbi:MAG: hypothetical protein MSG64_02855 [Pyrinomonadaceae bacterium MAG19_C2-C3]|nr:hypothetical protein [Pyrinomonadaceae bacterium MAG19_C2-C3]